MIDYDFGFWGVGLLCTCRGAVFPRSTAWAITAGGASVVYSKLATWYFGEDNYPQVGGTAFTALWSGWTFILGFLLVFRTQIAFSRFWEGATVIASLKGVWINSTSNIIAFTTDEPDLQQEAHAFHHLLVRLMSLLFCAALQQVTTMHDHNFEQLGDLGLTDGCLEFLATTPDKAEVILHWVQRLIVTQHYSRVLPIPAPILSRVFQELGNGMEKLHGARKIADLPFPFPYAQALSMFLLLHWVLAPIVAAFLVGQPAACFLVTAMSVFAFWSVNYIAVELEMPFGEDANDLPMTDYAVDFNHSLLALMAKQTQELPDFNFKANRASLAGCRPRLSLLSRSTQGQSTPHDWSDSEDSIRTRDSAERGDGSAPSDRLSGDDVTRNPSKKDSMVSQVSSASNSLRLEMTRRGSSRNDEARPNGTSAQTSESTKYGNGCQMVAVSSMTGEQGSERPSALSLAGCHQTAKLWKELRLENGDPGRRTSSKETLDGDGWATQFSLPDAGDTDTIRPPDSPLCSGRVYKAPPGPLPLHSSWQTDPKRMLDSD
eukprot:TRINITY_DN24012_c0_g1_i1.p1 TRINITY_DN24012_c0_g1~~TRINITY_DN24012_c0_g1_i1.p1  ORF type:complete len:545 (-),score=55.63 TRINITY_DN24012_c0_g1_i1:8-1642(-)